MTDQRDEIEVAQREIEEIQAGLRDRYEPRPGETYADAATARGRLEGEAIGAICRAAHSDLSNLRALTRAELEQLVELLGRLAP